MVEAGEQAGRLAGAIRSDDGRSAVADNGHGTSGRDQQKRAVDRAERTLGCCGPVIGRWIPVRQRCRQDPDPVGGADLDATAFDGRYPNRRDADQDIREQRKDGNGAGDGITPQHTEPTAGQGPPASD